MVGYSLYLHIPFCNHRCGYCDFNTFAGMQRFIPRYVEALCREVELVSQAAGDPPAIRTIFFGGGTPSLLTPEQMGAIFNQFKRWFDLSPLSEVTLEANPGTVTLASLTALRKIGFNRISFGMQSARPEELRLLERQHTPWDVFQSVRWARQAGFENLSLDLIFGLPDQSLPQWQFSLETALKLNPEHLSFYSLTVEEGTPLFRWVNRGLVQLPDDDISGDMYEWSMDRLADARFEQYEISNWARSTTDGRLLASEHNLTYWHSDPYLGLGSGAHGYAQDVRTANFRGIMPYIRAVETASAPTIFPAGPAAQEITPISTWQAMQEYMMVGLRLTAEGVSFSQFHERFNQPLDQVFPKQMEYLIRVGLLEQEGDILRLTRRGRLLGNQVFMQFVGNPQPAK
jgi:oxygen-independent coproporphyrinogen-3 oxidase